MGAAGFDAYRDKIDCFKSGREGPLPATVGLLEGLAGGADVGPDRKSSPSNESAGCFGCALGGGGAVCVGGPVLGRAGAEIGLSPNKSTLGACRRTALGPVEAVLDAPALCDVDLSILAFSCTTLSGCKSQHNSINLPEYNLQHHRRHRLLV